MNMDNPDDQQSGASQKVSSSTEEPSFLPRRGASVSDNNWRHIEQQTFHQVDIPPNNNCLFWAVTLAYLIPVKDDDDLFSQRYEALFGCEEFASKSLNSIKTSIQNYNFLCDRVPDTNRFLTGLIGETLRNKVVDYMSVNRSRFEEYVGGNFDEHLNDMKNIGNWGGQAEIRAICDILNVSVVVSGASEFQYGNGKTRIQLFHVGLVDNGAKNYYNFGLEQTIINSYQTSLNNGILEKLNKYYSYSDIDDFDDKSIRNIVNNSTPLQRKTIDDIAKIKFPRNGKIMFKITSVKEIDQQLLLQYQTELMKAENGRKFLVVLIDLSDMEWATLVIHYKNEQFHGHYVDSLGRMLPEVIRNFWKQINNGQNVNIVDYTIPNNQRTDYNYTGIVAVKDAEYIIQKLQSVSVEEIQKEFNENSYCSSLMEDRRHLAEILEEKVKMKAKIAEDILRSSLNIVSGHSKLRNILKQSSNPNEAISIAAETLKTYKEIYKFQKSNLGQDHEYTLNALSAIAFIINRLGGIKSQNNTEEALQHHEDVLKLYEVVHKFQNINLSKEHELKLNTLADIAYTNNKLGGLKSKVNPAEALKHYQEAYDKLNEMLEVQTRSLGKGHEQTLKTLRDIAYTNNNLGGLKCKDNPHEALRHHEQALEAYKENYKLQNNILGREHGNVINDIRSIAYSYNKVGALQSQYNPVEALTCYEEASELYKEALELQRGVLTEGDDHLLCLHDVAYTNNCLGRLKSQRNPEEALEHYDEALKMERELLQIQTRTLGKEHETTKKTANNLNKTNNWRNKLQKIVEKENAKNKKYNT